MTEEAENTKKEATTITKEAIKSTEISLITSQPKRPPKPKLRPPYLFFFCNIETYNTFQ